MTAYMIIIILYYAQSHRLLFVVKLLLMINQYKNIKMKKLLIILIASFATFTTFAQKAKGNKTTSKLTMTVLSNYSCPMHHDVVSNEPESVVNAVWI